MFKQVILVDVVFLRAAKRQAKRYGANCKNADITGAMESIYRDEPSELPHVIPELIFETEPDLVISLNLLSQLPIIPRQWLSARGYHEQAINDFCMHIQQSHLDYLKKFTSAICITDSAIKICCEDGEVLYEQPLLDELALPLRSKEWEWDIAPIPEMDKYTARRHRVKLFDFTPRQAL